MSSVEDEFVEGICRIIKTREVNISKFEWEDETAELAFYDAVIDLFEMKPLPHPEVQNRIVENLRKRRAEIVEKILGREFRQTMMLMLERVDQQRRD